MWPVVAPFARNQESILLLSEMHAKPELRKATLRFLEPGSEDVDLGWFQAVPGETLDCYGVHSEHKLRGLTARLSETCP